jgi:hypothetical protein
MTDAAKFRRVVLGIRHNAPRHGLRQATDLAALLQAELRGLFLRGDELAGLAAMPFAREFRPLEGGWHAIEREELSQALDVAARSAERSFSNAVRGRNLPCGFEVVQGSIASAIASISRAGDILVIPEPASSPERVTLQFKSLIEAALNSAAAVMVVPERVVRESGPVVALAGEPHDASIEAASVIASLSKEQFSIVDMLQPAALLRGGAEGGIRGAPRRPARGLSYSEVEAALRSLQERLLVLSRGVFDSSTTAAIASIRRVPVLIVEPRADESERKPEAEGEGPPNLRAGGAGR